MSLYYKLESWHKCGSFKERGALNVLLQIPRKDVKGIIVASLSNVAIAMGICGAKLNIKVAAVIPNTITLALKNKISDLGVQVIVAGNSLLQAQLYAQQLAEKNDLIYINGRDDPRMLEGYGSIALEILRDIPYVDAIIVPVGTGGLAAAIATVVKHDKPDCLVYGVQPVATQIFNLYKRDLEQHYQEILYIQEREYEGADEEELEELRNAVTQIPDEYSPKPTLADSIAVSQVGANSYVTAVTLLDRMVRVEEESIAKALLHIMEVEHLVVDGAAACPLATIIENLVPELKTKTVVCILTGGNVDCTVYARSLHRGMSADRRLVKFKVQINNSIKDISRVFKILSLGGYRVVQQNQCDRWMDSDTRRLELEIICQASSPEHGLELKKIMETAYPYTVVFETAPFNIHPHCSCFKPLKSLMM
ncbi:uncharacterized protein LOC113226317 [Hyposmocoma kahamanoa]|uniref:uncharacterized protein LOC113226317 n=1 Tax=Hyposmocoma kahamanoa TaxID=1477025 RepID=UPI000E6D6454|nr:uncharacterized protein LOC113226317 [Hyposmocoma kahamanoa]